MATSSDGRQTSLAEDEADVLSIIERVCSIFSLLGCLFTIVTFSCSKAFHKPINRLVFYASIGNAVTNIATLIARSYVDAPNSFGCQLQGFLIQMSVIIQPLSRLQFVPLTYR